MKSLTLQNLKEKAESLAEKLIEVKEMEALGGIPEDFVETCGESGPFVLDLMRQFEDAIRGLRRQLGPWTSGPLPGDLDGAAEPVSRGVANLLKVYDDEVETRQLEVDDLLDRHDGDLRRIGELVLDCPFREGASSIEMRQAIMSGVNLLLSRLEQSEDEPSYEGSGEAEDATPSCRGRLQTIARDLGLPETIVQGSHEKGLMGVIRGKIKDLRRKT